MIISRTPFRISFFGGGTDSRFVNLGSGKGYSIEELVETLNSFISP